MTNVVQPSAEEPGEPVDPEQPPTPREPFADNPEDSVEIELYAESWDPTLPGTSGKFAQRVAQLERELTEKNERVAVLENAVDKLDGFKDDFNHCSGPRASVGQKVSRGNEPVASQSR